jgi:two-component system LytT family response regulator
MGGERYSDSATRPGSNLMQRKALLVDDERLARNQLRAQLTRFPEIHVVAEADCVPKALDAATRLKPDIVFLDIQMPGQTGFDFLEQADGDFRIIFVTAFDRFALRAFELNALDYLMKPVTFSRLAATVQRITSVERVPRSALVPLDYSDHLFVSDGNGACFVKVRTIKSIVAAGPYSEVFTADGRKWTLLEPIKNWEERLPCVQFVRTHRSCIINLDYVARVEALADNTYEVFLRDQAAPLPISRRYALALKSRLR